MNLLCKIGIHKFKNNKHTNKFKPASRKCLRCKIYQELLPGGGDFDWVTRRRK